MHGKQKLPFLVMMIKGIQHNFSKEDGKHFKLAYREAYFHLKKRHLSKSPKSVGQ